MKKRPNIIIFNPDEMRWDTMGHMGNPAAQTPFLDSLLKQKLFPSAMPIAKTRYVCPADAASLLGCILTPLAIARWAICFVSRKPRCLRS